MALGYPKESEHSEIPTFKTLAEWEPKKSTEFDVCAAVCRHLLTQDDAPDVEFVDGIAIYPPLPEHPTIQGARRHRRILIYQEFSSMSNLLQNVSLSSCSPNLRS